MQVKIEKLDYEGRGLTHVDGLVVFVPGALPNEEVEIEIVEKKKHFAIAQVKKILTKNKGRVPSFCPYSNTCGGCNYSCVSYQDSIKYKKEIIMDILTKNGIKIPDFEVIPSRPVLGYRNKIRLHVENGEFGYYKEESHEFVKVKKCFLANDTISSILSDFQDFYFTNGILTIRSNEKEECILKIETEEEIKIKESLLKNHNIVGIILNEKCVYGKNYLVEERENISYQISIDSFFQVNPYISECIVKEVSSHITKEDILFDLYCGVGFFSLRLHSYAKQIIGIESNLSAVLSAKENARRNQIKNVSFHVGKVEDVLEKIPMTGKNVIVDPPRSGLHKKVVEALLNTDIKTIFYVSCNPITLVRDLKRLCEKFEITFFKCFDMFAYTKHLETLVIMERKKKNEN